MNASTLHEFESVAAPVLVDVDSQRGLIGAAGEANSFLFRSRDYGRVRAGDIWNAAYEEVQNRRENRFYNSLTVGVGSFLLGMGAGIAWPLVSSGAVFESVVGLGVVFGAVAVSVGSVVTAFVLQGRSIASQNRSERQISSNGNSVSDAPKDKAVGRMAARFLRRYREDAAFAQSIPYGSGLMDSEPMALKRDISQAETDDRRPVHLWGGAPVSEPRIREMLGDTETWNRRRFADYVALRFAGIQYKNPGAQISRGDMINVAESYNNAWFHVQDHRRTGAAAGVTLACCVAPIYNVVGEAYTFGQGPIAQFVHEHNNAVAFSLAVLGGAIALWHGLAFVKSARTHGWDIRSNEMKPDSLDPAAPADPAVICRARREADKRLVIYAREKGLTL